MQSTSSSDPVAAGALSDDDMDCRFSDWEEEEGEEEVYELRSLIIPEGVTLPTVAALIAHDKEKTGFDLSEVISSKCGWGEDTDEVLIIKLVNFMRAHVRDIGGGEGAAAVAASLRAALNTDAFTSDEFMRPTLQDDALLFLLCEYVQSKEPKAPAEAAPCSAVAPAPPAADQAAEVAELRRRLRDCEALIRSLAAEETEADAEINTDADNKPHMGADTGYFGSYSRLDIHEVMLADKHRTETYAAALAANSAFITGKIVLDVGCGSGILSMLAARAGAKLVIGIDVSDILDKTRIIVKRNGFEPVIKLVQGKVEECIHEILLLLPKDGKVDCIVSEWMGYGLYYENMLASVIFARDRFLRPGGLMLPSRAQLFLETMTAREAIDDRVEQWNDMYGFDMKDLKELFVRDAQVQLVPNASDITSDRLLVHDLDLNTAGDKDLDFIVEFNLVLRDEADLKAFVITFDTPFDTPLDSSPIILTTSAQTVPTHWKHTVLWLTQEDRVAARVGDHVSGKLEYKRSVEHNRDYSMAIQWKYCGVEEKIGAQVFYLSS